MTEFALSISTVSVYECMKIRFKVVSWAIVDSVMGLLFGVGISGIIARLSTVQDFGLFSGIQSYFSVLGLLTGLGLASYVSRKIALDYSKLCSYVGRLISARVILSPLALFLGAFVFWGSDFFLVFASWAYTSISATFLSFYSIWISHENAMTYYRVSNLVRALTFGLCFVTLFIGLSIPFYLLSASVVSILGIFYLVRELDVRVSCIEGFFFLGSYSIPSLPLLIGSVFESLLLRFGSILLSHHRLFSESAEVAVAIAIVTAMTVPVLACGKVIFPKLVGIDISRRENVRLIVRLGAIFFFLGLVSFIFLRFTSFTVVNLLYGKKFGGAVESLNILAISLPVLSLNRFLNYWNTARGKNLKYLLILIAGFVVQVVFQFFHYDHISSEIIAKSILFGEFSMLLISIIEILFRFNSVRFLKKVGA